MNKIFMLALIVAGLTGCTTSQNVKDGVYYKGGIEELRVVSREKRVNYLDCVKSNSIKYSKSKESAGEAASAAVSRCELQLIEAERAFFNQVHAVGKRNMTSLDIKLAKESSAELKTKAHEEAIRIIIDERMKQ